jgi:hypothetical protein
MTEHESVLARTEEHVRRVGVDRQLVSGAPVLRQQPGALAHAHATEHAQTDLPVTRARHDVPVTAQWQELGLQTTRL